MAKILADQIVDAVRSVVGNDPQVGLHVPDIGAEEKTFVNECLDSTFVSSVGPFVNRFEDDLASITGAKHVIAVANGTAALQVALVLAGVNPGEEVLIPALSFIATANAVVHAGGVPHFIDSDRVTMGMSPESLSDALSSFRRDGQFLYNPITGRRVAAIVPMHALGHPVAIERIVELSNEYGIPIVEDAAESLGSKVGDRHTGTFGLLGVVSFNGNKIVTTGGGGAILTDDPQIAIRAKHLTTTAKLPHAWAFDHDEVAWNYRMPNLNAAMGVAQLTKLDSYLEKKRELARRYAQVFRELDGVSFVEEPAGTKSNYWLCAVRIDSVDLALRDEILGAANSAGLQCRPFWSLLSEQVMYRESPQGALTTARDLHDSVICIPSSPGIIS